MEDRDEWERAEQQALIHSLQDHNADLQQKIAELEYERREDQEELRRHPENFTVIGGLASDIEEELRWFSGREMHPTDQTLDEWFSIIRSIRNIVG